MSSPLDNKRKREIWNRLKTVALEDGELSQEEQQLLANVILDFEQYSITLENALKDGIIDKDEEKQLFEGRMRILESAYEKAREDAVISKDEQDILKAICQIIREINN